jgi:light-regulated signal transduction histidine kinase (bacteriophytochrome)
MRVVHEPRPFDNHTTPRDNPHVCMYVQIDTYIQQIRTYSQKHTHGCINTNIHDIKIHTAMPCTARREYEGTGLGLSIVKSLVESHGGVIRVASSVKPSDHGTKFTIWLPTERRDAAPPSQGGVSMEPAVKPAVSGSPGVWRNPTCL